MNKWLQEARRCAVNYEDALSLIIFDIKTAERIYGLRSLVRENLPVNFNTLYSTSEYSDRGALESIYRTQMHHEGVTIDADNNPARVQSHFVGRGVRIFLYGIGLFIAGIGPNVCLS